MSETTAQKLAGAGLTVVGVDRNEQGLKALPDDVRSVPGDATDPADARRLVDEIASVAGPPSVLVNVIGTYHLGAALEATPDDLRHMIDVNLAPRCG
jgi:NAD(P)-dependent dehydrogenase (short-subunit alcohol dehydrogenase family)